MNLNSLINDVCRGKCAGPRARGPSTRPAPGICGIQASHSSSSNIIFLIYRIDSTWHAVMLHEGSNLKVYWNSKLRTNLRPFFILCFLLLELPWVLQVCLHVTKGHLHLSAWLRGPLPLWCAPISVLLSLPAISAHLVWLVLQLTFYCHCVPSEYSGWNTC